MAVDPSRTPGTFAAPPPHAPYERAAAEDPVAHAARVAEARRNERALEPLITSPLRPPVPVMRTAIVVSPSTSRLRTPGQSRPSVMGTPVETTIILTDVPGGPVATREDGASERGALEFTSAPVQLGQGTHPVMQPALQTEPAAADVVTSALHAERPARPAIDPTTAAYLDSPVARAARALQESRSLTHQPAASDTDSPSRGRPSAIADPGKQITGGFGDAGDAQYFPLDGSELRELVRGLMSVVSDQIEHDLRFSMAICYPRVTARVVVEIDAYATDGGQYDPSFQVVKVMPPHEKTPLAIARERADAVCFVVVADKVEMTAAGESISPPNAIRQELGLVVPRKQSVGTPHGRLIVDLPA